MIKSVVDFLKEIESQETHISQMFRGHANSEWELLPSMARINPKNLPMHYDLGWRGVEDFILDSFMKHAVRFLGNEPKQKLEVMIHAQHHGVPTRLLDWSTNPLKALYFAIENPNQDDSDGIVYVYSPTTWYTSPIDSDVTDCDELMALHPNLINERVVAQEGCFTLFPFAIPEKEDVYLLAADAFKPQDEKLEIALITIPKSSKKDLRKQLVRLGVSDASMFPDLDGIAKSIRRECGCL